MTATPGRDTNGGSASGRATGSRFGESRRRVLPGERNRGRPGSGPGPLPPGRTERPGHPRERCRRARGPARRPGRSGRTPAPPRPSPRRRPEPPRSARWPPRLSVPRRPRPTYTSAQAPTRPPPTPPGGDRPEVPRRPRAASRSRPAPRRIPARGFPRLVASARSRADGRQLRRAGSVEPFHRLVSDAWGCGPAGASLAGE